MLLGHAERKEKALAVAAPIIKPLEILAGLAEEFKLHLLKLTGSEGEVSGSNFISEGLTDLANAERKLTSRCAEYVLEINEYSLSGLGTEIKLGSGILGDALERLEHHIKLADAGEIALSAAGARNLMLNNIIGHLVV